MHSLFTIRIRSGSHLENKISLGVYTVFIRGIVCLKPVIEATVVIDPVVVLAATVLMELCCQIILLKLIYLAVFCAELHKLVE